MGAGIKRSRIRKRRKGDYVREERKERKIIMTGGKEKAGARESAEVSQGGKMGEPERARGRLVPHRPGKRPYDGVPSRLRLSRLLRKLRRIVDRGLSGSEGLEAGAKVLLMTTTPLPALSSLLALEPVSSTT
jgi:hypothetical protein